MNPLHLSGYGVKVKVKNLRSRSELLVTDGRENFRHDPATYSFRPRRIPHDSIIIDGHSGYVSLQAFHWLSHNRVPVFILNFDGKLITSILPPSPVKADIRAAQIRAMNDREKCFTIARELVRAKLKRSLDVLGWLGQRYDIRARKSLAEHESLGLPRALSVNDLRVVEGRIAHNITGKLSSLSSPNASTFEPGLPRSGRTMPLIR